MGELSEAEVKAVQELKRCISDLPLDDYERQDFSLVRWVRAKGMDIAKAEEMLRKSLEWRELNGIPTEIASWEPPPFYAKYFPYWLAQDKDGLPIGISTGVAWDPYVQKELAAGRKTTVHRYLIQINNRIEQDMKARWRDEGKPVTEFRIIFDLKGFSLRHLTSVGVPEVTLEYLKFYDNNYPETLKAAYIVNAPKLFTFLFELVKKVISSRTLSKVEVYDSDHEKWQAVLLQHIPADQLPKSYGGTREEFANFEESGFSSAGSQLFTSQMTTEIIKSGQTFQLPFHVEAANQKLSWIFRTENHDIGFSISYNGEEEVFPHYRAESHLSVEEGSFICKRLGKYILTFDNSYSMLRAKTLHYFVAVEDC